MGGFSRQYGQQTSQDIKTSKKGKQTFLTTGTDNSYIDKEGKSNKGKKKKKQGKSIMDMTESELKEHLRKKREEQKKKDAYKKEQKLVDQANKMYRRESY